MRIPSAIQLHKASKTLTLRYGEDSYDLPAEFLRVHSPSAEVQGHGNPVLQYGKLNVGLVGVEPAGQYALKLSFDDGHDERGHVICNIRPADCQTRHPVGAVATANVLPCTAATL